MSGVTRRILANILFGVLCIVYGFIVTIRLAIQLALAGRRSKLCNIQRRSIKPACLSDAELGRHNYVQLKDVKLHYVEAGERANRPLLLCLHGFPGFWYSWRNQLRAFSDDFHVVAVDMRGYGDSDKPYGVDAYATDKLLDDVEQLIRALGRTSCILMGHGAGGIVAWTFAERFPQMVERLVVLNAPHPEAFVRLLTTSFRHFFKSWFAFFVQLPYLPELYLRSNDLGFIDDAFRPTSTKTGRPTFCDHDIEAYKYTFGLPGALTSALNHFRRLRSAIVDGLSFDDNDSERRRSRSRPVGLPVLILYGDNDSTALGSVQLAHMSRDFNVERNVECVVHVIKGGGHFVQQDSADVVNGHIRDFLVEFIRASKRDRNSVLSTDHNGSLIGRRSVALGRIGVHALVGRVSSAVSSSGPLVIKLSNKVAPVVLEYVVPPVVTQLPTVYGWMSSLNRKLLST